MEDQAIYHTKQQTLIPKWEMRVKYLWCLITLIVILLTVSITCIFNNCFSNYRDNLMLELGFTLLFLILLLIAAVIITYIVIHARQHNKYNNLVFEIRKFEEDNKRYHDLITNRTEVSPEEKFKWEKEKYENEKMFKLFEEFIKASKPTEEKKLKLWEEIGEKLDRYINEIKVK